MSNSSLLKKGLGQLQGRGFDTVVNITDKLEGKGTAYIKLEYDDKPFYLRAKEYVYEGKAPFGEEMVEDALADGAYLVIYFDDLETCFVFDPGFVQNYGEQTVGESKHSDERPYLEVELDEGAQIDDWLEGDVTPATTRNDDRPERPDNTINASLDHYK